MYELVFYETISGEQPFGLFVEELDKKSATDRTARTQLKQIVFHLDLLAEASTRIGTTQKTPPQEITRAKREMADWLNRYPG